MSEKPTILRRIAQLFEDIEKVGLELHRMFGGCTGVIINHKNASYIVEYKMHYNKNIYPDMEPRLIDYLNNCKFLFEEEFKKDTELNISEISIVESEYSRGSFSLVMVITIKKFT